MNKIDNNAIKPPQPYDSMVSDGDKIPLLLEYWNAIFRHKTAIALIVAVTLIVGIIATLLTTPFYSSSSRIEINRSQDKVTNVESLKTDDNGESLEFYQTQYALLESRSLAERVARDLNLSSNDSFFTMFDEDPDNEGLSGPESNRQTAGQRAKRLKTATEVLLENVSISPIRGSSLIDIRFSSPDPQLSAQIANAWVEQFIASALDRRFDSTADARKFLEERLGQLRKRLEDSERQLVTYADNKEIVTLSSTQDNEGITVAQRTLASSDLESLNGALLQATADRIAAESEARQSAGDRNALSNLALNNMRDQRATVDAEYAKLLVQFEPEYPAAKALASQLAALDASIAREEARSRTATVARYQESLQR